VHGLRRCRACAGAGPAPGRRGAGPVPCWTSAMPDQRQVGAGTGSVPGQRAGQVPCQCQCRARAGACWCSVGSCLNAKCCKILPPASSCGSRSRAYAVGKAERIQCKAPRRGVPNYGWSRRGRFPLSQQPRPAGSSQPHGTGPALALASAGPKPLPGQCHCRNTASKALRL
jgi:hypothetical protein